MHIKYWFWTFQFYWVLLYIVNVRWRSNIFYSVFPKFLQFFKIKLVKSWKIHITLFFDFKIRYNMCRVINVKKCILTHTNINIKLFLILKIFHFHLNFLYFIKFRLWNWLLMKESKERNIIKLFSYIDLIFLEKYDGIFNLYKIF